MYSSPEEISRLKNSLRNDPGFLTSTSWPCVTEWCSSCKSTRSVRLALPEEETETALEEEEDLVGTLWRRFAVRQLLRMLALKPPSQCQGGGAAEQEEREDCLPSKLCSVSNEVCPCPVGCPKKSKVHFCDPAT